jgi:hypothetical protein
MYIAMRRTIIPHHTDLVVVAGGWIIFIVTYNLCDSSRVSVCNVDTRGEHPIRILLSIPQILDIE